MKINISLSVKDDSIEEKRERLKYDLKKLKRTSTSQKNRAKAARRKLETAQRYAKSKNPETAAKYKKRVIEAKQAVQTFERHSNKNLKDIERIQKMLAKLKG